MKNVHIIFQIETGEISVDGDKSGLAELNNLILWRILRRKPTRKGYLVYWVCVRLLFYFKWFLLYYVNEEVYEIPTRIELRFP